MTRPPTLRPATPDTAAALLGLTFQHLAHETQASAHRVAAGIGLLTVAVGCVWTAAPLPTLMRLTGLSPSGCRKGLTRAVETGILVRRGAGRGRGLNYEYALAAVVAVAEEATGHPVRAGPKGKREHAGQRTPAISDVQPAGNLAEAAPDPDRSGEPQNSPSP